MTFLIIIANLDKRFLLGKQISLNKSIKNKKISTIFEPRVCTEKFNS